MPDSVVLTLPGWQGSGPDHWQSQWERGFGAVRVEQHDWWQPLRGDWLVRLDEVVQEQTVPVVLAAHSLGCVLVAAWARYSHHVHRVRAALLVAPVDPALPPLLARLPSWAPVETGRLPFDSLVVASSNDPYAAPDVSMRLATAWGSRLWWAGALGHLNAESGLGSWPEGWACLYPWGVQAVAV